MFCKNCGAELREGARFCPECGLSTDGPAPQYEEYSYETTQKLFPLSTKIALGVIILLFVGIGAMVALAEGFWFVPLIMGGVVILAIFIITWVYKGRSRKWGKNRTLWIIRPDGFGSGYPPDVAKRMGITGAISAAATAGRENWGVTSHGINMARNLAYVNGLPIRPWTEFISAEYRASKREIALHLPTGQTALIYANPDNYSYVEQLVRGYMQRVVPARS